jgi:hypothetical protein
MLVLAMQFSRSADAGACGAESEDEDAGAAHWGVAGGASR